MSGPSFLEKSVRQIKKKNIKKNWLKLPAEELFFTQFFSFLSHTTFIDFAQKDGFLVVFHVIY